MTRFPFAFVTLLLLVGVSPAENPATLQRVDILIAELGSPDFRTREAAVRALDQIGRPALMALRNAVRTTGDAEIRQRAERLAAKIGLRVENEDAVAATRVTLPAGERTLDDLLQVLTKQVPAEFVLTDPSHGNLPVQLPAITDLPFWLTLENICQTAKLEIGLDAVPEQTSRSDRVRNPTGDVAADLKRITEQRITLVRKLQEQMLARQKLVANPQAQQIADEAIAQLRKELAQNVQQLAALQVQQMGRMPGRVVVRATPRRTQPPGRTVIVLQPKSVVPLPSGVFGALRIVARPFPDAARPTVGSDVLPVLLELQPEPRLNWQRVDRVSITKAVTPDGREIAAIPQTTSSGIQVRPVGGGNIVIDANGGVNLVPSSGKPSGEAAPFVARATQSLIQLRKIDGDAVDRLERLEGTIHATIRTEPIAVVAIESLQPGKAMRVSGRNNSEMTATLTTVIPGQRYNLSLTLKYDPATITPVGEASRTVQQNVIGVARSVTVTSGGNMNNQAFDLTDADGNSYTLKLTQNTSRMMIVDNKQDYERTLQLVATAPNTDIGPPVKVTFRGTNLRTVEIPFTLRNVPLLPGNGPSASK